MKPERDTTAPRTAADLRAIARFIRNRVGDEYRGVGGLDYHLEKGMTIQARFPRDFNAYRDTAQEYACDWLNTHTPKRFLEMASALASLAEELCKIVSLDLNKSVGEFRVERAWPSLVGAAHLWRDHPEFQAGWEPREQADDSA